MEKEKIKFYSPVTKVTDIVMLFVKIHERLGFRKLMSLTSEFVIDGIKYYDDIGIHNNVILDFEYLSSNYISSGKPQLMKSDRECIVVCWEDDCNLPKTLVQKYDKYLYTIIELKDFVEILPDEKSVK